MGNIKFMKCGTKFHADERHMAGYTGTVSWKEEERKKTEEATPAGTPAFGKWLAQDARTGLFPLSTRIRFCRDYRCRSTY